jgi:signal transduction histidine kinase
MAVFTILRALLRDRTNLFQSFMQPILLAWILAASVNTAFSADTAGTGTLRAFFLSFSAAEFYSVVVLIVTLLVASQYATDMAVQCASPTAALGRPVQYGSPVRSHLSVAVGVVLIVLASAVFFLAASRLLLGVSWPWASSAFWVLLGGVILLSVSGGFALGSATGNRGFSDLVISVIVFGSALAAGAFFPYPETSRVWALAPYNPFSHLLRRFLVLLNSSFAPPGWGEYVVWIAAIGLTVISLRQQRRPVTSRRQVDPWEPSLPLFRGQGVILCGVAIVILPVAIWLFGPADYLPGGVSGSAGFMHPYAGLMTVLILLLDMLLVAPLVDGSVVLGQLRSFRGRFLLVRLGFGGGLVLASGVVAAVVWRTPGVALLYAVAALVLFQLWALGPMILFSEATRDRTVYTAVALTATLLITFLGGSLWRPSPLRSLGHPISYLLPNGLLLHHPPLPALLVGSGQAVLLFAIGSGEVRHRLHRALRGCQAKLPLLSSAPKTTSPNPPSSDPVFAYPDLSGPDRVRTGVVESLILRERKRTLDEVHDTLGHGITGALWQIRSARGMTEDSSLQEILDRAASGLENGLAHIREYLRDSAPRRSNDWSELYSTVAQFSQCPVHLSVGGDTERFDPDAVTRFTQTVRELLTNALRYGEPTSIDLRLMRTSRFHRLEYRERGKGWGSKGPRMGYGLSTVRALYTDLGGASTSTACPGRRESR